MLFNSINFIFIFLPITLIIYFALTKARLVTFSKIWLILVSLYYYGYYNHKYVELIICSISINFLLGNFLGLKDSTKKQRKIVMILGIIFNVGLLGYFKYTNFFIDNINAVFHINWHTLYIILPLAISFFTFQQLGYLIDCYNGMTQKVFFLDYMLFVAFFPQLLSGPIVRYKDTIPQFISLRTKILNYNNLTLGSFLFIIGLFKKIIFADTFSKYVILGFNWNTHPSFFEAWMISFCYAFQIYFDFSGYIDMATGVARMLNIKLPINFNSPYKATSIADFWRRWHITLSSWFRDYVFYPLIRTNFCKKITRVSSKFLPKHLAQNISVIFALFIVWFLLGLWHGAAWNFILYGMYYCVLMIFAILFAPKTKKIIKRFNINEKSLLYIALKTLWTFSLVCIGYVLFRTENSSELKNIFSAMFGLNGFLCPKIDNLSLYFIEFSHNIHKYNNIILYLILAFIFCFICKNSNEIIESLNIKNEKLALIYSLIFSVLFVFVLFKMIYNPYIEFIYFKF